MSECLGLFESLALMAAASFCVVYGAKDTADSRKMLLKIDGKYSNKKSYFRMKVAFAIL